MARLPHDDYLQHIRDESARLRAVLAAADPTARVPSCPDWSAQDLLAHHAGVLHFWATIVERRPAGPEGLDEPELPTAYDELLAFHEAQSERFVAALTAADPAEAAWTWAPEQTVGFTFRRQAHESLIHRLDAELTAGAVTPLDPALAADGVDEALDVMYGGKPSWGTFTPDDRFLRVECTDTGDATWVQLGHFTGTHPDSGDVHDSDDIAVVEPPDREPDAVVAGPAGVLDAWLWRRVDDQEVAVSGDEDVYARFRACVDQPID
jgi:uncharacterized protein (TIGR03083 family)